MEEKRKNKRLNIFSFSESEVYASLIINNFQKIKKESLIPQSFFMVFDRERDKVFWKLIDKWIFLQ